MVETSLNTIERPSALRLGWVRPALLEPRQTFAMIASQTRPVWITPLLLLSLSVLFQVLVAGQLKTLAAASGQIQLPPDFQYYTPEMQAQFMQAMEATSGPVFLYVFPGLVSLTGVWAGWLLTGSLVHLSLTLLGGRGSVGTMLNVVAWSSLPLVLRELVRGFAMLSSDQLIANPGLSGFAPPAEGNWGLFVYHLLTAIDIYLLWSVFLMALGARAAAGIPPGKALMGVGLSAILVVVLRSAVAFGVAYLGTLTITRPFLF